VQTQTLQPPVPTTPALPTPSVPPRHRTPLGQITISLCLLAVGILGIIDLAGASVPGSAYFAVPLTVLGIGLVVGAWYGKARWLFAIGAVLAVLLAITAAAEAIGPVRSSSVTWKPTSANEIESTYKTDIGNATLDLTGVNFAGQDKSIRVDIGAGNLTIIVGSNVDVTTVATVDVGNANVFGTRWGGVGQSSHTVADNGADGPGGGRLSIEANVDVGNLEVRR